MGILPNAVLKTKAGIQKRMCFITFLFFSVQCLQCQHVFDKAQAIDQPSDSPEHLRTSTSYRGRSISKLMCPFCFSQILQQSMPRSGKQRSGWARVRQAAEWGGGVVGSQGQASSGVGWGCGR